MGIITPNYCQVVEFFGLPGIGKTTVAQLVTVELRRLGWPVFASHEIIGDDLSRFKKHCVRSGLILSEFPSLFARRSTISRFSGWANQSLKARSKTFYNTLTLAALLRKAQRRQRPLLLDQGIAQAAWSVLNFADSDITTADRLLPKHNWSPLIVAMNAPTDVVVDRIGSRHSRHSRMQREAADWARAEKVEAAVLGALEMRADAGQLQLMQYGADATEPEALAKRIATDISSALATDA